MNISEMKKEIHHLTADVNDLNVLKMFIDFYKTADEENGPIWNDSEEEEKAETIASLNRFKNAEEPAISYDSLKDKLKKWAPEE